MAEVVVELGNKEILRIPLKGPSMTIGRDPQCDLHLDNRALSRRHAQIEKRGAAIWVRDLNSQNGTYVNGDRINEPRALNGGDIVEVGRYLVRVEGAEEARSDTPVLTLTGPEGRHRFAMVGDEIIIGRAPSCDIAIGHKSISRRHVRIAIDGDHFVAEDLGSQNGTRINGKKINGPTAFKRTDRVQMSEFTIEVGFLEQAEGDSPATGEKPSKTMMIDRSELAKAAYVGGDFEKMHSNAANSQHVQVGNVQDEDGGDLEDSVAAPIPDDIVPPRGKGDKQRDRGGADHKRRPQGAWLAVTHPDLRTELSVSLLSDVTLLGEDASPDDGTLGRSYANQGYLLFVKNSDKVIVSAAGDRRLVTVNGKPSLFKALSPGDTVEFGLLTVVVHLPG